MAEQLSLRLPVRPALGRGDFFVAPANAMAVALIEDWRGWSGRKLLLIGPPGSGKTHLAHVWAKASGARLIAARALAGADIPELAQGPVAVEDVPDIAGDAAAEATLFHLHNLVLAEGHALLITARSEPQHWNLQLPDLVSRMRGTPAAKLDAPDDALLTAVLAKLFADRQMTPTPELLTYLVRRIGRSFEAAAQVVERLDRQALSEQRPITRALAAQVLDKSPPAP